MASKTNGLIQKVNPGNNVKYSIASSAYGVCETPAGTAIKTVDMTGFNLAEAEGTTVHIQFLYGNTITSELKLNINGTGEKPIFSTQINTIWPAGAIIALTYDGTNWKINSSYISAEKVNQGEYYIVGINNNDFKLKSIEDFVFGIDSNAAYMMLGGTSGPGEIDLFKDGNSSIYGALKTDNLTQDRTYLLPNETGTIALTSNIPTNISSFTNDSNYVSGKNISLYYGTCATAAGTAAKGVTCNDFKLTTGATIFVKMTNAQTYNGAITLNINSTGAKAVKAYGSSNVSQYYWIAGELVAFTYDGTNYIMHDSGLATTTYYGMTKLTTSSTSTSTTTALTPASLNNFANGIIAPAWSNSSNYSAGTIVRYGNNLYKRKEAGTASSWDASQWEKLDSIQTQLNNLLSVADALVFKGAISGKENAPGEYTPIANCGDTYKVASSGYINGQPVEVGDMIICTVDGTAKANESNYNTIQNNWIIIQTNVDGSLFKSTNILKNTGVLLSEGENGKVKTSDELLFDEEALKIGATKKGVIQFYSGSEYGNYATLSAENITDNQNYSLPNLSLDTGWLVGGNRNGVGSSSQPIYLNDQGELIPIEGTIDNNAASASKIYTDKSGVPTTNPPTYYYLTASKTNSTDINNVDLIQSNSFKITENNSSSTLSIGMGGSSNKKGAIALYGSNGSSGIISIINGVNISNQDYVLPKTSGWLVVGGSVTSTNASTGVGVGGETTTNNITSYTLMHLANTGVLTAATTSLGSNVKPVYLDAGKLKAINYELNTTINSGTTNTLAYYSNTNNINTLESAARIFYNNTTGHLILNANSTGAGISLINENGTTGTTLNSSPNYGLFIANTSTHGTFGDVVGNQTMYFTIGDTNDISKGWIWKYGQSKTKDKIAASLSRRGVFAANALIRLNYENSKDDVYILAPQGGYATYNISTGAIYTTQGALKILLPPITGSGNNAMVDFFVDINSYNSTINTLATYHIYGQIRIGYSSDKSWEKCKAISIGQGEGSNYKVRFGIDSNSRFCVVIGETTSSWGGSTNIAKATIRNVSLNYEGYNNHAKDWAYGWNTSFVTDISDLNFVSTTNGGVIENPALIKPGTTNQLTFYKDAYHLNTATKTLYNDTTGVLSLTGGNSNRILTIDTTNAEASIKLTSKNGTNNAITGNWAIGVNSGSAGENTFGFYNEKDSKLRTKIMPSGHIIVQKDSTSSAGISLWGEAVTGENLNTSPQYGFFLGQTTTYGTFGDVTGAHAMYCTMDNTSTKGWIWKYGRSNATSAMAASLSRRGIFTTKNIVAETLQGDKVPDFEYNNTTDISGSSRNWVRLFDSSQALNLKTGIYFITLDVNIFAYGGGHHILGGFVPFINNNYVDNYSYLKDGIGSHTNVSIKNLLGDWSQPFDFVYDLRASKEDNIYFGIWGKYNTATSSTFTIPSGNLKIRFFYFSPILKISS